MGPNEGEAQSVWILPKGRSLRIQLTSPIIIPTAQDGADARTRAEARCKPPECHPLARATAMTPGTEPPGRLKQEMCPGKSKMQRHDTGSRLLLPCCCQAGQCCRHQCWPHGRCCPKQALPRRWSTYSSLIQSAHMCKIVNTKAISHWLFVSRLGTLGQPDHWGRGMGANLHTVCR